MTVITSGNDDNSKSTRNASMLVTLHCTSTSRSTHCQHDVADMKQRVVQCRDSSDNIHRCKQQYKPKQQNCKAQSNSQFSTDHITDHDGYVVTLPVQQGITASSCTKAHATVTNSTVMIVAMNSEGWIPLVKYICANSLSRAREEFNAPPNTI